ncbi:YeeE/YedE family protein [Kovacikia minuta]|uniref:YeeE/YedE family protein n=1 Tax=Kovacikia minuta TaxID=2931930 RepID=UPI0028F3FC0F|nr:YeeE/YedE family protein [Kovacikia minuta]
MILTLITFCIGAFWASLTRQAWAGLPATPPISLGETLGWPGAVLLQLVLFVILAVILRWWSRGDKSQKVGGLQEPGVRTQEPELIQNSPCPLPSALIQNSKLKTQNLQLSSLIPHPSSLLYGPWSLVFGAVVLAILNWLTLLLSGQPWRITWGFALWAAKLATMIGWDAMSSPFWGSSGGQQALSRGIFADISSVMNLGIVLGAILAVSLAGRLTLRIPPTLPVIIPALLGGLIMGYGAFLAYGCNVSAFFGGIASTSLHGWVWIAAALIGTVIGIRLRLLLKVPN